MQLIKQKLFETLPDENWSFVSARSTEKWTHGYHRYPAKFLPNIVSKIIEDFKISSKSVIGDVFAGCGTTLVEAKIHGIQSIGVDINPVAELITKVKTTPIEPDLLENSLKTLLTKLEFYKPEFNIELKKHDRIDYWFEPQNKHKIAFIYSQILQIEDNDIKDFALCALSNILKNASRWLMKATKPQVDPNKITQDPFALYRKQLNGMSKRNRTFYNELEIKGMLNLKSEIKLEDARKTSIDANSLDAIITSPPYVTSYEYADIHQLTGYWFDYFEDLAQFRKGFIGTSYSNKNTEEELTPIAKSIVDDLLKVYPKGAKEVCNYFNDMDSVAQEMYRILKPKGKAFVVIGNTKVRDVHIKSAEVFAELLVKNGIELKKVIKRSIPNKINPTFRDKKTGKFSKLDNENGVKVYPEEYILILKKN